MKTPTKAAVLDAIYVGCGKPLTLQEIAQNLKLGHNRSVIDRVHARCTDLIKDELVKEQRTAIGPKQFQLQFVAVKYPAISPTSVTVRDRIKSWFKKP